MPEKTAETLINQGFTAFYAFFTLSNCVKIKNNLFCIVRECQKIRQSLQDLTAVSVRLMLCI